MAAAIAAQYPGAARAVLFYGSCLRERELDGLMLDFYLIVSDYRAAYGRGWFAFANRLVPPNVFPFEHDGLAAKYAVLSEADFAAAERAGGGRRLGLGAVRAAVAAGLGGGRGGAGSGGRRRWRGRRRPCSATRCRWRRRRGDPLDVWRRGFELTYASELRAERKGRSGSIVDADPERYRRFGAAALPLARAGGRRGASAGGGSGGGARR